MASECLMLLGRFDSLRGQIEREGKHHSFKYTTLNVASSY